MTTMAAATLYERIGGAPAVDSAVDGFYARVLADDELAPYFAGIDLAQLKAHQRVFLTMALGGPARYGGRAMDKAHEGLDITSEAFGRVVGHLADTLGAPARRPSHDRHHPRCTRAAGAADRHLDRTELASEHCRRGPSRQQGRCTCRLTSC
jgi:hemoglobin